MVLHPQEPEKKSRILLKRQSISRKQLEATVGRKNVTSQATVKAIEATVGGLQNRFACFQE